MYSKKLDTVFTARRRIERDFDPDLVRRMKATAVSDLMVAGPDLATHAFRAGLVDECHLFVAPMVVGGGKRAFLRPMQLLDEHRFGNGMVHLRYRTRI